MVQAGIGVYKDLTRAAAVLVAEEASPRDVKQYVRPGADLHDVLSIQPVGTVVGGAEVPALPQRRRKAGERVLQKPGTVAWVFVVLAS
jgi:hypothetical protein